MNEYFQTVISNLTEEDLRVLARLHDQGANIGLKSLTLQDIQTKTGLSTFKLNKVINQLTSLLLIKTVGNTKTKLYCISDYGENALQTSLEGEI